MLLLVSIVNFADRFLLTGLIGPIKAEFNLGDGMMGLLMGPAFVILYVAAGIPLARLADRWSRTLIIAGGCVMWSLATIATGMATSEVGLVIARACVGIGEAAFAAPAYSLLYDYFKAERRGLSFAILGMATYIGQIVGQAGGPALAHLYDWRFAFYLLGCIGVGMGLLMMIVVREPKRVVAQAGAVVAAAIPMSRLVSVLSRNLCFWLMTLGFGLGAMSGLAFGFWGPELFARNFGVEPVMAKTVFAINFGLSGLLGMLLFGAVSDRMSKRGMVWPIRLSAIAMCTATLLTLTVTWSSSFEVARWLAIPCGLLGGGWSVGVYSTLQYFLPANFRATATAMFLAVTTLLSYLIGPWMTGILSQAFGNDDGSLRLALSVMIPMGILAAGFTAFASRRLEKDRARLAEQTAH